MLATPESSACMPEAQLRITVQPGTFCPQPMRSAATRPILTSSTEGAALRWRGPERLGQSEILREMVHADHLVAQLRCALEQGLLLGADDMRGERSLRELLGGSAAYRPGFLGRADPGLDRFGLDRRV